MIRLVNMSKSFTTAAGTVDALKHVNLTINDGDIYGIIGMSGAGKSTLVRCINMLEKPTEGSVILDRVPLESLSERQLRSVRREITMIFQGFNLLMQRNCLDTIMLPLKFSHVPREQALSRARELLELVGLPEKEKAYPAQLSGGQQQRIAIARALATDPKVLLCDEATSALDPKTTHSILELIRDINRKLKLTVIIITHQMSVVQEICNRVAILENGTVVEEGDVDQVFSEPKARATQSLVYPEVADGTLDLTAPGTQCIRISFDGADAASKPLLADMILSCGIRASVLMASTRSVGDKTYGYMLLEIPGGPSDLAVAVDYLTGRPNIRVQITGSYDGKEPLT